MAGELGPDPAWLDGMQSIILNEIERDWATLSGDPRAVARRVAVRVGPMLFGASDQDDVIRGAPWGESR